MSRNGNANGNGRGNRLQAEPSNGHPRLPAPIAASEEVPGVWLAFIRYCRQMGFGEIEKVRIQDGVPVLAEVATRKVKFGL